MSLPITALVMVLFVSLASLGTAAKAQAMVPPAPSDKVTVERVSFNNRIGINVAGDLYMPKNIDNSKKHRAIVVGHPFGGVKEQTSGLHAQKLAEMGYVTLAFDSSFYGDSGGMPRHLMRT
jgi:uncharacterized protein